MRGHPIQTDIRQSNVLLLYHIPLGLYNAGYNYLSSHLQTRLEDNLE